jgi:predicted amidohydrolase
MVEPSRTITVAAAQLPARPLAQAAQALADIAEAVAAAGRARADLIVLPECSYPAYWLGTKDGYFQADILRGRTIEHDLAELARRHRICLVAGVVHEQDGALYDAAVLFDASGHLAGRHCKTFLWDAEHDWYQPGTRVQPVETPFGRVGLLVCAEGRSPEVFASHAAQMAGLLAMPTAWVNAAASPAQYYNPQPDFIMQARAAEFGLPIVCANKFGRECQEARFCGMSLIVSADGRMLAKAPPDRPALLTARVRLEPKRLILPDATVRRLLADRPPVLPPPDAPPLRVAVLPPTPESQAHKDVSELLAGRAVHAVVSLTHAPEPTVIDPYSRISSQLQAVAHAKIGFVTAPQARSFVWPRMLSLDGAQVLCVIGRLNDMSLLRTRAAENRVFVVAAPDSRPAAISPGGAVLAQSQPKDDQPLIVDLNLTEAADKLVAPRTNIWTERRCGAYCLIAEPVR